MPWCAAQGTTSPVPFSQTKQSASFDRGKQFSYLDYDTVKMTFNKKPEIAIEDLECMLIFQFIAKENEMFVSLYYKIET